MSVLNLSLLFTLCDRIDNKNQSFHPTWLITFCLWWFKGWMTKSLKREKSLRQVLISFSFLSFFGVVIPMPCLSVAVPATYTIWCNSLEKMLGGLHVQTGSHGLLMHGQRREDLLSCYLVPLQYQQALGSRFDLLLWLRHCLPVSFPPRAPAALVESCPEVPVPGINETNAHLLSIEVNTTHLSPP